MDVNNNPPTTKYRRESLSDNSLSIEQPKQELSRSTKYYLFAITSIIYLVYGCQNSLLGPTMKALTRTLHITEKDIAIVVAVKCAVVIVSTPVVSFSFKKIGHRQFQFAAAVIIFSLLGGATPYMGNFSGYLVNNIFAGFVVAFIEAAVNLTILELFSLNSKIYMQIGHGCFTVGTIFGGALSGPFLSKSDDHTDNSTTTETPSESSTTSLSTFELNEWSEIAGKVDDSRIRIPYLLVSFVLILAAIWLIVSQILRPYVPEKRKLAAKQTSKKITEERVDVLKQPNGVAAVEVRRVSVGKQIIETVVEQIDLPKQFYVVFLGLIGVLFMCYMCMEALVGMFLPSFLVNNKLGFEEDDAAFMESVVFVSMAMGRVFTIVFSTKITCKFMLFFNFSITLLGFFMLTFFAAHSRSIVWLSTILIGGGLSSTYPIIMSYVENRIVITNNVQLYLLLSSLVLLVFVPIIVGNSIRTAPMVFAYVCLSMAIISLSLMFIMHLVDVWKRRLIKQIKEQRGECTLAEQSLDFNI